MVSVFFGAGQQTNKIKWCWVILLDPDNLVLLLSIKKPLQFFKDHSLTIGVSEENIL